MNFKRQVSATWALTLAASAILSVNHVHAGEPAWDGNKVNLVS